jgi:hypothetical protein
MEKTKIGAREIPIRRGAKTIVRFSGGNGGPAEAGDWEFWTVVGPERGGDIGRCRAGADPGERWRRMEGAKGYEKLYAWASTSAQYMRPASVAEVEVWLNKNQKDARFAEAAQVDGKEMALAAKYRLRPK